MLYSITNNNNQVKNLNDEDDQHELEFYTTVDVARMLGCSIPTARQLFYRRDFPALKIGKNFKVEKHALQKWCSERRFKP